MSKHQVTLRRDMNGGSSSFGRLLAVLASAGLLLGMLGIVTPAQATGNQGTIKVHALGSEPGTESNEPKVCAFNLEFFNFIEGVDGYIEFDVQGGDGPAGVAAGPFAVGPANADGYFESEYFNVEDGPAIANGHYKVTMYGKFNGGPNYEDVKAKSKVFKVDCQPTEPPPTIPDCPAIAGTVVVTPGNLQGFDFSETRATGHYEFLENGLRIYTESNTSTDKVAAYKSVDVPLTDVGDPLLDYVSTFGIEPGFQLVLDFDGNGTPDGILVGEDVYNGDWWLTNGSAQFVKDGAPNTGGGSGSNWFGTLDEWLGSFPDAVVKQFGFSLGSGVKADGVIDKITFACTEYVFSTDKTPPPTPFSPTESTTVDECEPATGPTNDRIIIPSDANFTYQVDGQDVASGPFVASGTSHTVTAIPNEGVVVKEGSKTEWTYKFTKVACVVPPVEPPVVVPPVVTPPVVTPPVVVPPVVTTPEPKLVKGKVKFYDKCGPNNFFKATKKKGLNYVVKGEVVREGVWLKASGKRIVVKLVAEDGYKVKGKKKFSFFYSNDASCTPVVDVPPNTGL